MTDKKTWAIWTARIPLDMVTGDEIIEELIDKLDDTLSDWIEEQKRKTKQGKE